MKKSTAAVLSLCFLVCGPDPEPVSLAVGYRPVYSSENTIIERERPRSIVEPGKIYLYDHYLLVNEVNKGTSFLR